MRCLVDAGPDGLWSWRLVSPNGRVVARSGGGYEDHVRCRDAFVDLCAEHAGMTGGIQHTADGNGWVWLLRDREGRPAAVSGRAYERYSTCRTAYERFLLMVAKDGVVWRSTSLL
ncbi:hypothetical protein [Streptomyces sp. NPDC090025]|uniref:hypothetical protein n=1 Tax=Streptomyces sp. NPDC090025 TaxID=3365922 RepID=UPI0038350608